MALVLTTIVGMTVVRNAVDGTLVKIGTLAMTVTVATTAILEMIVTAATIVTLLEKNVVAGKNVPLTLANALDPQHAVRNMRNVAPGHLPLNGNLMKGGLQGTMIDEDHMMFGEALTLILTVVGTNVAPRVTRRRTDSTRGRRGPMEITVGDAE